MNGAALAASNLKRKGLFLLLGLLLLAAVSARVFWQRQAGIRTPAPVPAMDDSGAELPVDPPALPPDNAAALQAAHGKLIALPATSPLPAQTQVAAAALDIGDLWQAEAFARTLLATAPGNRPARLTLAESLRRQARFAEAERLYQQLLKEDARDSDAYLGLADTAFDANRRPEAFTWLARAVSDGAQTSLALTTLAHRYQDWKDYPKAKDAANRAIQVSPEDITARLQLASIQVESGELEAGHQTLETILQKDPNNGLANRLMGVTLMNATYAHQDINRARLLLERAVELNAKDMDIYRSAAIIYRQQRLYRLAAQAYDALLHLDPTSVDGRYGLGQVYALLGKPDLSRQQLALYMKLDERQRQLTRLSEEVVHHPTSAQAHAALAKYLVVSGDYARAVTQYQVAAGLAPHDAAIQTGLQQLYAHLGWGLPEHKSS